MIIYVIISYNYSHMKIFIQTINTLETRWFSSAYQLRSKMILVAAQLPTDFQEMAAAKAFQDFDLGTRGSTGNKREILGYDRNLG